MGLDNTQPPALTNSRTFMNIIVDAGVEHIIPSYLFSDSQSIQSYELSMKLYQQAWFLNQLAFDHIVSQLFPHFLTNPDVSLVEYTTLRTLSCDAVQGADHDRLFVNELEAHTKILNQRYGKFFRAQSFSLIWAVPKIIHVPYGPPALGGNVSTVRVPIVQSDSVIVDPQLQANQCYLLGWVELSQAPLIRSKFSDLYVKNMLTALQGQLACHRASDPSSCVGGTLVISGKPSVVLLDWLGLKDSQPQDKSSPQATTAESTSPDIDVVYAVELLGHELLLPIKLSKSNYRLKLDTLNACSTELIERIHRAQETKHVNFVLDHVLYEAVRLYDNTIEQLDFNQCFLSAFESACRQYTGNEMPSLDLDFEKRKDRLIEYFYDALPALSQNDNDEQAQSDRNCYKLEAKRYVEWSLDRAKESIDCPIPQLFTVDWATVEKDVRRQRNYKFNGYSLLGDLKGSDLDRHNTYMRLYRYYARLIQKKSAQASKSSRSSFDEILCRSSASLQSHGAKKDTQRFFDTENQLIQYYLFNLCLIYSQCHESASEIEPVKKLADRIYEACDDALPYFCQQLFNFKTRLPKLQTGAKIQSTDVQNKRLPSSLNSRSFSESLPDDTDNLSTIQELIDELMGGMVPGLDAKRFRKVVSGLVDSFKLKQKSHKKDQESSSQQKTRANKKNCAKAKKPAAKQKKLEKKLQFKIQNSESIDVLPQAGVTPDNELSEDKPRDITALYERLLNVSIFNNTRVSLRMMMPKRDDDVWRDTSVRESDYLCFSEMMACLNQSYRLKERLLYFFHIDWAPENLVKYIYVVMQDHQVRIVHESIYEGQRPSHSELANVLPVWTAGELWFRKQDHQWVLDIVNNASGHYRPSAASLAVMPSLISRLCDKSIVSNQARYCNGQSQLSPIVNANDPAQLLGIFSKFDQKDFSLEHDQQNDDLSPLSSASLFSHQSDHGFSQIKPSA